MNRFLILILLAVMTQAQTFPRIGNYFLDANVTTADIDSLARCDFIVFDHMVARERPKIIDSIRSLNPEIKIIAYVVSQEINLSHTSWEGSLNQSMLKEINQSWWLLNANGDNVQFWPGTHMLNIGAGQPEVNTLQWNRYLAGIITDSILTDSRWDGVYLDNCWSSVSWVDSVGVDLNRDGIADSHREADSLWESGMNVLLDLIRSANPDKIIVGNGGYRYGKQLNGSLFEDFPTWGGWWRLTDTYLNLDSTGYGTSWNLINGTTHNTGVKDLQMMRLGLATTLLGDGFFSYDYGANDHSQNWWFDEYSADLGTATGPARFHHTLRLAENSFESGFGGWSAGNWKMTSTLVDDSRWNSAACSVSVTGEEQWNQILRSPLLTIGEGAHVKLSIRIRVDSAQKNSNFFALLRKGETYEEDIHMGTAAIFAGMDTTLTFYSDSAFTGSGYSLMLGMEFGGSVTIDDITLESDEELYLTRTFEKGMVVVNPSSGEKQLSFPGYKRIRGTDDPLVNNGESGASLKINGKDGVILLAETPSAVQQKSTSSYSPSVIQSEKELRISPQKNSRIEIVSLRGQLLYSKKSDHGAVVPLSNLASGTYLLRVRSGNRDLLSSKFIVR